jgi:hypothetical protein
MSNEMTYEEALAIALKQSEKKKPQNSTNGDGISFARDGENIQFVFEARPNKPSFTREQIQKILNGMPDLEKLLEGKES